MLHPLFIPKYVHSRRAFSHVSECEMMRNQLNNSLNRLNSYMIAIYTKVQMTVQLCASLSSLLFVRVMAPSERYLLTTTPMSRTTLCVDTRSGWSSSCWGRRQRLRFTRAAVGRRFRVEDNEKLMARHCRSPRRGEAGAYRCWVGDQKRPAFGGAGAGAFGGFPSVSEGGFK